MSEKKKLPDFRSAHAYVLLGEAGSGKTTAFNVESAADEKAALVSARHFLRRHLDSHPEWRSKTLYVDGLDEMRASGGDPREPINSFLRRIERLGKPRFRLSCREEFWLGPNDLRELASVVGSEDLHLLRLDPLGRNETREILVSLGVEDPAAFLWKAVDAELEVFIENPLLLEMLAKAAVSGSLPAGRLATFDRACAELVEESNEEHIAARDGSPFSTPDVVLAAGRLCALQLLTGKHGWSRRGRGDEDCPALSDAGDRQDLLKFALDSKLFQGSAENRRIPRHRAIGEFLAATYLNHLIVKKHLVAERVLALLMGIDGMLMPDLRGVSVWLAAVNRQVRRRLIEADPIGVAFFGDAGGFTRRETRHMFSGIEAELPHRWEEPSLASIGALMAGPARELLWEFLRLPDRSGARQDLLEVLLRGMATSSLGDSRVATRRSARNAKDAGEALTATLRDPYWESRVRHPALVALIHIVGEETGGATILRDLLDDLKEGSIVDEGGELRGELLTHLYPRHLAAESIWDYLPPSTSPYGDAREFWTNHLVDKSPPEDVRALLDTLTARAEELIVRLAQNDLESLVLQLLARGLQLFGEKAGTSELYVWFELVEADFESKEMVPAHCRKIAHRFHDLCGQKEVYDWLCEHSDIQLALVLEGLKRKAESRPRKLYDFTIGVKFLGDSAPVGFRKWCLKQAVDLSATNPEASRELCSWALARNREAWGPVLGYDEATAEVGDLLLLRDWNLRRLAQEEEEAEMAARMRDDPSYAQFVEQRKTYMASVRGKIGAIRLGHGPPDMLHNLGKVYMDGLKSGGRDGARDALVFHLESDHSLVKAVVGGFRRLVGRRDLPDLTEIIRLHEKSMMSFFALPFLAGLTEDDLDDQGTLQRLDDEGLRRALGFYLLSRLPTTRNPISRISSYKEDCRPRWYRQAIRIHPQTVADAFVAVHLARVRSKESPDQHLHDLARSDEYAEVARLAVPRMFTPFPSRCAGESQLEALRQVLWAAIRYMHPTALCELIQRRLARTGMDTGQRAMWLASGALVAPQEWLSSMIDFLSDEGGQKSRQLEQRVVHVVHFLVPDRKTLPHQEWPTVHLAALIRAVGRWVRSPSDDRHGSSGRLVTGKFLDTGEKAQPLITGCIEMLADRVDHEAIAALADLAKDPTLAGCRGQIVRASDAQAAKRRISAYTAPTLRELREAFVGGPPASAADLAALVTDTLSTLANRIRNGNTDAWRQYWHTDPKDPKGRRVLGPKPEDLCRDHLLSDLQLLLAHYNVDAAPEGHHAEDARSDIITSHGVHAVPVEIKKTDSTDLWRAARDQLIAKYVRDPRSGGYGIYLVFWFGPEYLKRAPWRGLRPDSPEKLKRSLEELLEPRHRRTIAIVVVDVSAPPGFQTGYTAATSSAARNSGGACNP